VSDEASNALFLLMRQLGRYAESPLKGMSARSIADPVAPPARFLCALKIFAAQNTTVPDI
jgi:hypothetical protein